MWRKKIPSDAYVVKEFSHLRRLLRIEIPKAIPPIAIMPIPAMDRTTLNQNIKPPDFDAGLINPSEPNIASCGKKIPRQRAATGATQLRTWLATTLRAAILPGKA